MKPKTIFYVAIAVLAALMVGLMIYSGVAYNKINKLENDKHVSEGKNIVYVMEIDKLNQEIGTVQKDYTELQKQSELDKQAYNKKVKDRDKLIEQFKKEKQVVAGYNSAESIIYFNDRTESEYQSDTTFSVQSANIKTANNLFVERDEAVEQVTNLRQSEQSLLRLNTDLTLEVQNREVVIDRLYELSKNNDNRLAEYEKQLTIQDDEMSKMKKRFKAQKFVILSTAGAAIIAVIAIAL